MSRKFEKFGKKLTSQDIKDFVNSLGAGGGGVNVVGIANIERFRNAPERMRSWSSSTNLRTRTGSFREQTMSIASADMPM